MSAIKLNPRRDNLKKLDILRHLTFEIKIKTKRSVSNWILREIFWNIWHFEIIIKKKSGLNDRRWIESWERYFETLIFWERGSYIVQVWKRSYNVEVRRVVLSMLGCNGHKRFLSQGSMEQFLHHGSVEKVPTPWKWGWLYRACWGASNTI